MFGSITFLIAVLIVIFKLCVLFTISKSRKKMHRDNLHIQTNPLAKGDITRRISYFKLLLHPKNIA